MPVSKVTADPAFLFTLVVKLFKTEKPVVIHAFDGGLLRPWMHQRIDVEVRQGGKVIFPRGSLWCATPGSIDDNKAKERVMGLVEMRPGDTDREYFDSYTPEQLAWAIHNGEALSVERMARYCDENGNVR